MKKNVTDAHRNNSTTVIKAATSAKAATSQTTAAIQVAHPLSYSPDMKISMPNGNKKVGKGVYTFSTLPGEHLLSTPNKGTLTNIPGTCSGCCTNCESGGCYAIRDAKLYSNSVIPAWGKNTLIMRNSLTDLKAQLKAEILSHKTTGPNAEVAIRIHASGEFETLAQLETMCELAKELPTHKFYTYTKRFQMVEEYLEKYGSFPENFAVNLSQWRDNLKSHTALLKAVENKKLNIFALDDQDSAKFGITDKTFHCPAVAVPAKKGGKGRETGIQCKDCRRCMKACGRVIAVYNH